jgi:DNA-binding beta-propeller fold protein YncE
VHAASIAVHGAESLELDPTRALAFTNDAGTTVVLDVVRRAVSARWSNGCATARGLAIDPDRGWVVVACNEGRVVVLDERTGATLGKVTTGAGLDRIAYDGARARVYAPSPAAAAMSVVALSSAGVPSLRGAIHTASDAHCAVTWGGGEVFVCVPSKGQLAFLFDPF